MINDRHPSHWKSPSVRLNVSILLVTFLYPPAGTWPSSGDLCSMALTGGDMAQHRHCGHFQEWSGLGNSPRVCAAVLRSVGCCDPLGSCDKLARECGVCRCSCPGRRVLSPSSPRRQNGSLSVGPQCPVVGHSPTWRVPSSGRCPQLMGGMGVIHGGNEAVAETV